MNKAMTEKALNFFSNANRIMAKLEVAATARLQKIFLCVRVSTAGRMESAATLTKAAGTRG